MFSNLSFFSAYADKNSKAASFLWNACQHTIRSISFDYVLVAAKKNVPKSTVDRDEAFFI